MKPTDADKAPRVRRKRSWLTLLRLAVHSRGTPEAIARGVAIGILIALSPTIGFQVVLALVLATLLRANRIAALVPVFLTNLATLPPVFGFTYMVGSRILPGRPPEKVRALLLRIAGRMRQHEFYNLPEQFREFVRIGRDLFWPMLLGGLIVGAACAALAYPATLWVVRRLRRRRSLRLAGRRAGGRPACHPRPDRVT